MPPFFDPRMRGFRERAEVAAVLPLLTTRLHPLPPESVSSIHAAGRTLAEAIVAPCAVPGFDRAAMDGYAVRAADTAGAAPGNPVTLRVAGEALPGLPYPGTLSPGEAVRIMTGAPLPAGADAIVPVERTQADGERVRLEGSVPPGKHVGRRGEDVSPGQVVLPAGRRLRPQDLGLLVALGVASVQVVRSPRVEILVTGDELLPAGSQPEGYRIVDSNSVMLAALVVRDGGLPHVPPILPDRRDVLREALRRSRANVLLVSGGSSVGQQDHAPSLVAELGELAVHGIAMRPGGPTGIGFLGDRPVFLLPGNPVACLCAYDLFAGLTIRYLGGRPITPPYPAITLPLAGPISSALGRVDYVRVQIQDGQVKPLATSGASLLSTTTAADGFVLVPADRAGLESGETVTVYLYDS